MLLDLFSTYSPRSKHKETIKLLIKEEMLYQQGLNTKKKQSIQEWPLTTLFKNIIFGKKKKNVGKIH